MELCSIRHKEVCFESRDCPLCEVREELEERIDKLEAEIACLENKIESY